MLDIQSSDLYNLEEESCEKLLDMHNNKLIDATLTALETGNLSPLVKEELKYTIQSRRRAKGQTELQIEFPETVKYELTDEEKEKIVRRREQNRQAAQRFRDRKKESSIYLCEKIHELESANAIRRAELKKLREEKEKLQKILYDHLLVCPGLHTEVQDVP